MLRTLRAHQGLHSQWLAAQRPQCVAAVLPPLAEGSFTASQLEYFCYFHDFEFQKSQKMIFAKRNGMKNRAETKKSAICPLCLQPVFGIGEDGIEYWSHMHQVNCDPWHLQENSWSIGWKEAFPSATVETPIGNESVIRLADIKTKSGVVIKLCSEISPKWNFEEIESFFGAKMIWVVDVQQLQLKIEKGDGDRYPIDLPMLFTRTPWDRSRRPLFFDFSPSELVYFESGAGFEARVGRIVEKDRFVQKYST